MEHPTPESARLDLLEPLGAGGSATVWRAWWGGRLVAVKQPRPEHPDGVARLERDARLSAMVDHPRVARPLARHETEEGPALVLPLAVGGSLADRLRHTGALPAAQAVRIGAQVADALAAVHAAGIVHRDVKPANVLLDADGDAVLSDFGSAITRSEATPAAAIEGSPAYLAPELLAGRVPSACTDLFSLGATLFELLTGRLPPTSCRSGGPALAALVPGLPDELLELVDACLSADPVARPASAGEVHAALRRLAEELVGWSPDADDALAAWSAADDPRRTRAFGPRPPVEPALGPAADAPSRLAVAAAAAASFVLPVAAAAVLSGIS